MEKIPNHVGIILDGNGRWAQEKGLSRSEGHLAGFENLKEVSLYIFKRGVKYLSVYAFSTENFKRSVEEVSFLMNLFVNKFNTEFAIYKQENIKVIFSGRKDRLSKEVLLAMDKITLETKNGTNGVLNICLNYGGQYELVDAYQKMLNDHVTDLTIEKFSSYLYQDLPNIDLLIRTSGEQRVSNFMLWQIAYAEMYFPKTYFPDFNGAEFEIAMDVYNKRDRRFGGINYENKSN